MADSYIDSTLATGLNDGSSWANAYRNGNQTDWTSSATRASAAGDKIYVAHNNNTILTADLLLTANANHTEDNPLQVIVANSSTGDPVTTYGTSGNGEVDCATYDFDLAGYFNFHGLRLQDVDTSSIDGGGSLVIWENCYLYYDRVTAEDFTISTGGQVKFIDCDISFINAAHNFTFATDACSLYMQGGSITTDSNVVSLFSLFTDGSGWAEFHNVDLTGLNSATDILDDTAIEGFQCRFINCDWPATMPALFGGTITELRSQDFITISGDVTEIQGQMRHGSWLNETTIYRADGAVANATNYSIKVESNSNAKRSNPFRMLLCVADAGDLNAKNLKIHFAQNTGAAIDDNDIWVEAYAVNSSITDRLPLGETTTTNHTDESGNVDWRNGAGALTGYDEQSCSVTFPASATTGLMYVYLCCAIDFTTTYNLYVDPYPVVT